MFTRVKCFSSGDFVDVFGYGLKIYAHLRFHSHTTIFANRLSWERMCKFWAETDNVLKSTSKMKTEYCRARNKTPQKPFFEPVLEVLKSCAAVSTFGRWTTWLSNATIAVRSRHRMSAAYDKQKLCSNQRISSYLIAWEYGWLAQLQHRRILLCRALQMARLPFRSLSALERTVNTRWNHMWICPYTSFTWTTIGHRRMNRQNESMTLVSSWQSNHWR